MQPRDGADCARAMFCGGRVKWGLTGQHRKGHPIGGWETDPCHHRKIERTESQIDEQQQRRLNFAVRGHPKLKRLTGGDCTTRRSAREQLTTSMYPRCNAHLAIPCSRQHVRNVRHFERPAGFPWGHVINGKNRRSRAGSKY